MPNDDPFASSPEQQVANAVRRADTAARRELAEARPAPDDTEPFGVDHVGTYSSLAGAYAVGQEMLALGILKRK